MDEREHDDLIAETNSYDKPFTIRGKPINSFQAFMLGQSCFWIGWEAHQLLAMLARHY